MKTLYTAKVIVKGGRHGSVQTEDKRLRMALRVPPEMGGDAEEKGTNPEELFAAAYGASFRTALENAGRLARVSVREATLVSEVHLRQTTEGGQQLAVELRVGLPGVERSVSEKLLEQAHRTCPYSKALRGNAEVKLSLVKAGRATRAKPKRELVSFGR